MRGFIRFWGDGGCDEFEAGEMDLRLCEVDLGRRDGFGAGEMDLGL